MNANKINKPKALLTEITHKSHPIAWATVNYRTAQHSVPLPPRSSRKLGGAVKKRCVYVFPPPPGPRTCCPVLVVVMSAVSRPSACVPCLPCLLMCRGRTGNIGFWTGEGGRAAAGEPSHSSACCPGTRPLWRRRAQKFRHSPIHSYTDDGGANHAR